MDAVNRRFGFEAIGTSWTIDIFESDSRLSDLELLQLVMERIGEFDKHYSRFRSDSLVAEMARQSGEYTLPDDAEPMFDLYEHLYKATNGSVTPLIGGTLEDAGYDAGYSLQPKELRAVPRWEDVLTYTFPKLALKKPVLLDFGAAGKGYLVDIVSELLVRHGVSSFCVDAGGDLFFKTSGNEPMRVGLEHPAHTEEVIGVAEVHNQSLCGSAGNRRRWSSYHHIIDPHALASPDHISAVWTVAESALLADGLATALFFAAGESLSKEFDFEYVLVREDFSVEKSNGFPGELFLSDIPPHH